MNSHKFRSKLAVYLACLHPCKSLGEFTLITNNFTEKANFIWQVMNKTKNNRRINTMVQQVEKCVGCKGTGSVICPICYGNGAISKKVNTIEGYLQNNKVECQTCQGTGKLLCKLCGGVGKVSGDNVKTGW